MRPALSALAVLGCGLELVAGAPAAITTVSVGKAQTTPSHVTLVNSPSESADTSSMPTIYPSAATGDAPYSVRESTLRNAITFPKNFSHGTTAKQPVIFINAIGLDVEEMFELATRSPESSEDEIVHNAVSPYYDAVRLDIQDQLLGNIQISAEYIAYCIHHVSRVSQNRTVAVVAFSEGNLAAQWAYKYWPSTRNRVTDHIGISAPYAGADPGSLDDPSSPVDDDIDGDQDDDEEHETLWDKFKDGVTDVWDEAKDKIASMSGHDDHEDDDDYYTTTLKYALPAVLYQMYPRSNFIRTLRANGGDAAFVPTTNIYNSDDDFFLPRPEPNGTDDLEARRPDAPVTNVDITLACTDPESVFQREHFALVGHPLTFALFVDALGHDGPGLLSRIDLNATCATPSRFAPFLSDEASEEYERLVMTPSAIGDKTYTFGEPPIKAYARKLSGDDA